MAFNFLLKPFSALRKKKLSEYTIDWNDEYQRRALWKQKSEEGNFDKACRILEDEFGIYGFESKEDLKKEIKRMRSEIEKING